MTDEIPVDAFDRLGLTTYEARVFVALQQLSTGTAREIASIADIPRSQVYDTAASLAERGLIEEQQSNPIRFQTVDIEEARERFRARYEAAEQEAFEYLESIDRPEESAEESSADVWTIRGRENVDARVRSLVEEATDTVLYGIPDADMLDEETGATLATAADRGVTVTGLSDTDAVYERFDSIDGVRPISIPATETQARQTGRILIADGDAVLLSIVACDSDSNDVEAAIWSRNSGFASVLIQLLRGWLDEMVDI